MKVEITTDGRATTATVTTKKGSLSRESGVVTGVGHAVCMDTDVFEQSVGTKIALGRAIQDVGRQLEMVGLGEVQPQLVDIEVKTPSGRTVSGVVTLEEGRAIAAAFERMGTDVCSDDCCK